MTLAAIGSAVLYTLFLWWFSTGAILWLDRRARATYRLSLTVASIVALAAVFGLVATMGRATPTGAMIAFTCAILIWGWHELSFLTGLITGPRTQACPPGVVGWRRFKLAAATLIHHEIALALTAAALVAATWGQPNPLGAFTFLILFACRISAKLNLFFGVPNFTDAFFPDHLRYLTSYLKAGPVSLLFPVSVIIGCGAAGVLAWRGLDAADTAFEVTAFSLAFALTALAMIEHAFMVLPLPDAALWRWAMPAAEKASTPLPLDL
jgi:putative photosynthetic complex assembly protein 2